MKLEAVTVAPVLCSYAVPLRIVRNTPETLLVIALSDESPEQPCTMPSLQYCLIV